MPMPKTSVNEHRYPLFLPDKVRMTRKRNMSPKTLQALFSNEMKQPHFGCRITPTAHTGHQFRSCQCSEAGRLRAIDAVPISHCYFSEPRELVRPGILQIAAGPHCQSSDRQYLYYP